MTIKPSKHDVYTANSTDVKCSLSAFAIKSLKVEGKPPDSYLYPDQLVQIQSNVDLLMEIDRRQAQGSPRQLKCMLLTLKMASCKEFLCLLPVTWWLKCDWEG